MAHVSIKDIARAAGVSHSTVSRALRNSALIRPATRERIQGIAREMGYSPDTIARSLVTGRTRTVGIVVTTITDPFVAELVHGIENHALPSGYSTILASSGGEPEREVAAVEMLRAKRVEAVIVTSSRVGALYLERLEAQEVPVVLINDHTSQAAPTTCSVTVDNRGGGRLATEHLVGLGHRRIAYVAAAPGHYDGVERQTGYRQALDAASIPQDPGLVLAGDGRADGGERAFAALQTLAEPATAVFCYNDMTAIGLRRYRVRLVRRPHPDDHCATDHLDGGVRHGHGARAGGRSRGVSASPRRHARAADRARVVRRMRVHRPSPTGGAR